MLPQDSINQIKESVATATSILILLPPQPDQDSLLAAQSLYHSLIAAGKTASLGCSSETDSSIIQDHIGNQTLVVSFDYQEDAVENVSYDIDDTTKKFNLRIQPRAGFAPLNSSAVQFAYTGAAADLVITLGVSSLEELGRLYSEEKSFLDQANVMSLTLGHKPTVFAKLNFNLPFSSFSEAVVAIIKSANSKLPPESATSLYQQIVKSTNNFMSPAVTADTFELAAFLLRLGAERHTPPLRTFTPAMPVTEDVPQELPPLPRSGVPTDWNGPKIYRGGSPLR